MNKTIRFYRLQCILKYLFLAFIVFIISSTAVNAQNTWAKKTDFPGGSRMTAVGFSINGKGYVGLGYGNKAYHDFWEYDPSTNGWTKKADYPGMGSEKAVGFSVGGKGYVGMGDTSGYSGRIFFKDFYEYDPIKDKWTKKADYPGGPVAFAVGFGIGSKGYTGTGWDGLTVKKDFYEYDPVADKWTRKADFGGEARMSATGFAIDNIGYLGTGNTLEQGQNHPLSDFWAYDPNIDKWQRKADVSTQFLGNIVTTIPLMVYDAVGFSINHKGYIGTGTSNGSTNDFSEYDPGTDQWTSRAGFGRVNADGGGSIARDNAIAFSIGAQGYIGTGHFGAVFNDFWTYSACGDKNFTAQFDAVQDNFKVSFATQKVTNVKYIWNFGDGTYNSASDTLSSVLHVYDKAGTYQVHLTVFNSCYTDTLTKTVTASGIRGITNNHGGNTGIVTANIIGSGFTNIYLNNGGQQIQGTSLKFQNDVSATAMFDLTSKAIGFWDVVAVFPGNKLVTLPKGYVVENGSLPKLSIDLTGDRVLREGFNQHYILNYHNTGNSDASLIPVFIGNLPLGTEIEIKEKAFDISTLPGYDTLKTALSKIPTTLNDTVSKTSFRMILIRKIPANSSGFLTLVFHVPFNIPTEHINNIICTIGSSVTQPSGASSPVKVNSLMFSGHRTLSADAAAGSNKCSDAMLEKGLSMTLEHALGLDEGKEDFFGYASCFSGVSDLVYSKLASDGGEGNFIDRTAETYTKINTAASCTRALLTTVAGASLLIGQPEIAVAAVDVSLDILADQTALERVGPLIDIAKIAGDCLPALGPQDKNSTGVIIGNATDPNELYGPGDFSASHYTNQTMLNYIVNFENKPESNLNAQTVTVVDTLKKNDYNLKTFGFTSVTIGDSTFDFKAPVQSFIHDFDFTAEYQVKARVVADFDTITGIAKWKFLTIDPVTNQVTTNALVGFLPPDKHSPKGQGFVGYQIAPKDGIGTGGQINNKAYITFDFNPVIPTNAWNSTFDFDAPQSSIKALPTTNKDSVISVQWGGKDNLSGIQRYNVFFARGNGPFQLWLSSTAQTTANFSGMPDSTYKFYSIAYDNAGNVEPAKFSAEATTTIKIPKSQNIKFTQIANKTFGDGDFDAGATATSALPLTYASSNTAVATIVNGKIHIVGAGATILTASQAGNDSWKPAADVAIQLTVNKATQTITFAAIPAKNYQAADFGAGASANSGLAVTYTSSNPAVLTISGSNLHIAGPGKSTIKAWQPGNTNYLPSDTVSREVQVLFSLPANNFNLSTVSLSCRNSNNGEIHITAITSMAYTAKFTFNGISTTYNFTNELNVKNLAAGTYNVCLTIAAYPDYQQCYIVIVDQPKDLSVYSSVDNAGGLLNLHLEGGNTFYVTLNGTKFTTTKKDLSLSLENGKNTISVTTDQPCQGQFDDTINLPLGISTYPNPFTDQVSVTISNDNSATAAIEVYTLYGKTVYTGKKQISQGKCSVNLASLHAGIYILKVTTDHAEKRVKIYKQ